MTFCLGMKVDDGLVAIADTRVTSGTERITAKKVSVHQHGRHSMFLMTSGLRSVRDKALIYFEEVIEESDVFTKLHEAVNAFANQIRRVSDEDRKALTDCGMDFNLHALVGGQLENDKEHKLFMIYPQGNWVEVGSGTPYYIIGESGYGKPILDRTIQSNSSLEFALKAGFLAFNATITCAVDVDYPIDVLAYHKNGYEFVQARYEKDELGELSRLWQQYIRDSVGKLPGEWMNKLLLQFPSEVNSSSV